jgi:hypothetical protein
MADEGRDDPDRAAILARRQRFIALALSGLSASCGKNNGSPQPCLDIGPAETSGTDDGATDDGATSAGTGSSSTGMPMPCLDIGPTTGITVTADDTGTDTSSGTDSSGSDTSGTDSTTG